MVSAVGQTHQFQQFKGAVAGFLGVHARHQQGQFHVLYGVQDRQQVVKLEDKAHVLGSVIAAVVVRQIVEDYSVNEDLSLVNLVQAG